MAQISLQEFVTETLNQVIRGVAEAKPDAEKHRAEVNPQMRGVPRTDSRGRLIQEIEFDVAVTTSDATKTKGGIGIVVGPLALGSAGQSDAMNQSVSRIRFSVPISLPS